MENHKRIKEKENEKENEKRKKEFERSEHRKRLLAEKRKRQIELIKKIQGL